MSRAQTSVDGGRRFRRVATREGRAILALVTVGVVGLLTPGCVEDPGPAPGPRARRGVVAVEPSAWDRVRAAARGATVRVRSVGCDGFGTGSAFLLDATTLVTNRHVVEGATRVDLQMWDGTRLEVGVAQQAEVADLAVLSLARPVPGQLADAVEEPAPGSPVYTGGYPLGEQFRMTKGAVVEVAEVPEYGNAGRTIRTTAAVEPGNSGGPMLDEQGRVVGVVFAVEVPTRHSLAIPIATLRLLRASPGSFRALEPC